MPDEITPEIATEFAVHDLVTSVDALGEHVEYLPLELGDLMYVQATLDRLIKQAWGAA